jgi:hypothetical protein
VPVKVEAAVAPLGSPPVRSRLTGFGPLTTAAAVVLIAGLGLVLLNRGPDPTPGGSPLPVASASASPTATIAPSLAPTIAISPTPQAPPTRPPATVALPYPDGCAAYGLSARRCAYIVDWALAEAGVTADPATIELLGDPACEGKSPDCRTVTRLGGSVIVRVRVIPASGAMSDHTVFCGLSNLTTFFCTETPRILLRAPMNGYHDLPCPGGENGPCATSMPTIAPAAAAQAVPLDVSSLTVPIDHAGPYVVDTGEAVLPNGILSEATASLPNDTRLDVLIPEGIRLEVLGEDGEPLVNIYDHGWRTGTETVRVRLVFTVESFDPGTTLVFTGIVVR